MPFDVTMPDGTVVQGVPDGTSKADFDAKRQRNMGQSSPSPQSGDKGLLGNIGQDISKGIETGKQILQSDQNPLSKGLQVAGKAIAGTANAVAGDVAKSAYDTAVPDAWKEKISGGIQKAMASPLGKAGIEAAQKGGLAYMDWAKQNPEKAANLESLVDIATVVPVGKVAGAIGKATGKVAGEASMISPIARGMGPSAEKLGETTEKLNKAATGIIERGKKSGGMVTANLPEDAKREISQIEELSTSGDIANAEKTHAGVKKFLDSISPEEVKNPATGQMEQKSGDLSIRNLLGHRQAFDTIATTNAGSAESIAAKKVSGSIEKIIDDAIKNDEITAGNKEDIKAIAAFKPAWSKFKQHQSLVKALDNADESSSKARSAMSKIRDSKFFNSYPPEAQKYINSGAKGSTRGAILDAVGKLKRIANFRNLGWVEAIATIAHSPTLAIGGAGLSAIVHGAEKSGKTIAKGDIRRAIKAVEDSK